MSKKEFLYCYACGQINEIKIGAAYSLNCNECGASCSIVTVGSDEYVDAKGYESGLGGI